MKNITLKTYGVGVYDDPAPFVLDEDLTLVFSGCNVANGEYAAVVKCNGWQETVKLTDNAVNVPFDELSAGELYVTVVLFLHGKRVTEWTVEPLTLTPVTVGFDAAPTVAALKAENTSLQQALTAYRQELAGYVKAAEKAAQTADGAVQAVRANALAAAKYMYRHYKNDLRDNVQDLSAQAFLTALGASVPGLTEEDLKDIKEFSDEEEVL